MADEIDILKIVDSHLVLHLLAPGEADVPHGQGAGAPEDSLAAGGEAAAGAGAAEGDVAGGEELAGSVAPGALFATDEGAPADALVVGRDFLPDNLVEDFVDEASDMLDDVAESYAGYSGWENPLLFGFVDGVLSVANDTYMTLEDSYCESADDSDFTAIDEAIDQLAQDFEGERAWDEAAKGHVRTETARAELDPAELDLAFWKAYSHGFMYGADAAYDLEWKVIVTPANNALLTDEDSISQAALARLQAESGGVSLVDRVLDMIGIDAEALAALGIEDDEDDEEDAND